MWVQRTASAHEDTHVDPVILGYFGLIGAMFNMICPLPEYANAYSFEDHRSLKRSQMRTLVEVTCDFHRAPFGVQHGGSVVCHRSTALDPRRFRKPASGSMDSDPCLAESQGSGPGAMWWWCCEWVDVTGCLPEASNHISTGTAVVGVGQTGIAGMDQWTTGRG